MSPRGLPTKQLSYLKSGMPRGMSVRPGLLRVAVTTKTTFNAFAELHFYCIA